MSGEFPVIDRPDGLLEDAYRHLNALYVKTRRHGVALKTMHGRLMVPGQPCDQPDLAPLGTSGAGKTATLRQFEVLSRICSEDVR